MIVETIEVRSVRIICDGDIKDHVLEQVMQLGATDFTWWKAAGKKAHELFGGFDRVCIEVWCSVDVAEKIAAHCQGPQFRDVCMSVGIGTLLVPCSEAAKMGC